MLKKRVLSLFLCIIMVLSMLNMGVFAEETPPTHRTVYLHAQDETFPNGTTNNSTVYKGEVADVYFAVDNPNRGRFEDGVHLDPQYDMNGYTLRICFDPYYFEFAGSDSAPIDYAIPDFNFDTSGKGDEDLGEDTGSDVPQSVGYYVYKHDGRELYTLGNKTYKTAFITVFYSGGYVPQKKDTQLWYNLAKLSLMPINTGSTDVFIDIDSGVEGRALELFAKNLNDELSEQTFDFNAVNGGVHHILIKDRTKPAPPIAIPTEGTYPQKVTVELTQDENCIIYYTDDGSDPATSSTKIKYEEPIDITIDTLIRTCAFRESDGKYSNTVDYDYDIVPDRPYLFDSDVIGNTDLTPDRDSRNSKFVVYVSDKDVFGKISDDSEVYYTFSATADAKNPQIGTDHETGWVKVEKQTPYIEIDQKRTVRLITGKMGKFSEAATYWFAIKPAMPEASPDSGEYDTKIDVTLSCETEGATIWYTTDGTDPKTSRTAREYSGIPITISKDTTLRIISQYDGEWSDTNSYYYLIATPDTFGVDAFYPPGVYEGSVNVTLTPNNPEYTVLYHDGDGKWKEYTEVLVIDSDTDITAKVVEYNDDGSIKNEGGEDVFRYKIKPLPPEFAPESTQFTNAHEVTIYTPESNEDTTSRFTLFYTLDGSDPITSKKRIKADEAPDSAVIEINKYTVITAVVLKDGESYSNVVKHSYDIVKMKPVKPLTTLAPGYYVHEIGGEGYSTQFMPVHDETQIYYTVCYDGGLCPDPVPNTEGTYPYNGTEFIDIKGNTVIKAVAVNSVGVKSDIGIFEYIITPEAPKAAPSATLKEDKFPVVPVDAVKGCTVKYKIGEFENEFVNEDDERFYIDTQTGNAYRDKECTQRLGDENDSENTGKSVTLDISAELDGVESDTNRYIYNLSSNDDVIAPPYADKETGTYEERSIDTENNLLEVRLYSLNTGGEIQYRLDNDGEWQTYNENSSLLFKKDTVLQIRYARDGKFSPVVSYVYNFIPLPPVITLASGTYSEEQTTSLDFDSMAPADKIEPKFSGDAVYSIWYRQNGDKKDYKYTGQERDIDHTMSFKAYVLNKETGRVSKSTIHYYIIESGNGASGSVYIAYPYDVERISASLLGKGDYAEGIKLLTQNKTAEIHYKYSYTRTDEQVIQTKDAVYDIERPIIPTALMEDITIVAWLEDENGRIPDSEGVFKIDFVHLGIPATSLEISGKVEFPKNTKYTLIDEHEDDPSVILYYTLDGSDPTDENNQKRIAYAGEELTLTGAVTVKAVYYSSCGKCVENCWHGVYGDVGTYKYTVPTKVHVSSGGSGGGGGSSVVDKTRKYTKDIFGNEHPTHVGYINGYPDGSVQPDGYITREEMAAILYRVTNHEYEKPFAVTGDVFPDVEKERWSVKEIEYMSDKDVIYGYPDGEFKPARNLTRAEFAALIFRFTGIDEAKNDKNPFSDLEESHWAYDEILALNESGLVEGYEDKTFKPENNITRAEVMTVMNKILGRKPLESYVKSLGFNPYNDLKEEKWYYVIVLEATITHNYWLDKSGYEYKWEDWK